jgi:hypothetical protein
LRPDQGNSKEPRSFAGAAPGAAAFLTVLARGLGRAGRASEGMAAIEQAFMLSERHEERWCLPEFLRNKEELRLFKGSRDALRGAEECLRQALDWAGRDGTLAWELRAAISLARLRRDQRSRWGRAICSPRCMNASPRGSALPICEKQSG